MPGTESLGIAVEADKHLVNVGEPTEADVAHWLPLLFGENLLLFVVILLVAVDWM